MFQKTVKKRIQAVKGLEKIQDIQGLTFFSWGVKRSSGIKFLMAQKIDPPLKNDSRRVFNTSKNYKSLVVVRLPCSPHGEQGNKTGTIDSKINVTPKGPKIARKMQLTAALCNEIWPQ